ncbi:MAG: hypothetical protein AAF721_00160 [Myxococcota bacterium]
MPEECVDAEATFDVDAVETVYGSLQIDRVTFAMSDCGYPLVGLLQFGSEETGPPVALPVLIDWTGARVEYPLFGVYPAAIWGIDSPEGTIEFFEPLDRPTIGVPDPTKRLHAQIDLAGRDWDLSLEVDAIYCGAVGDCMCITCR